MTAMIEQRRSEMTASRSAGLKLALAAAVVSGVAIFVNGKAVSRFPSPTVYTTGKNLVAGVVLLAITVVVAQRARTSSTTSLFSPIGRNETLGLVAVAVVGGAVPFVLFFEGLARATSSDAGFIHKTLVIWVAVLAAVFLREQITVVHLGAVAVLVVAQIAAADGVGSIRPGLGEAMILAATLCWSVELIVVKQLVESLHPSVVAASRIAGGAVLLILWLSVTGRLGALTSLTATQWAWVGLTGSILSVFVTVWFAAVARAQVIDVTAILVLGAVITGTLDLVTGGVAVPVRVVGWVLIAVAIGVLVVQRVIEERERVVA